MNRITVGEFYNEFIPQKAGIKYLNPEKLKEYPQWDEGLKCLFTPVALVVLKKEPKGARPRNPWLNLERLLHLDIRGTAEILAEFKADDFINDKGKEISPPVMAHARLDNGKWMTVRAHAVDVILSEHRKANVYWNDVGLAFVVDRKVVGIASEFMGVELTDYQKQRQEELFL